MLQFFHRLLPVFQRRRSYTPSWTYSRLAQTQVCPALRNFDDQRPFDGFIKVGIIKDDKRRVAAQLQGDFFDVFRALAPSAGGQFRWSR